ncbi:MAG TPA: cytochrome c, partial [Steroidobacteraceae bacterium]|nr:cytochrome c [Steroidobacteraceae bacterium]
ATAAIAAEPPAAVAPAADGKALFTRRCGICHLADGGGTWMLERRLGKAQSLLESRTDLQVPYVRLIARRGLNGMPRFTRVELPDADLEAIAAYLTRPGPRP